VERILDSVREYYTAKIEEYGPTPEGVDWNSLESQQLRFEQLAKVCDASLPFSINDYGCGYGALVDYLVGKGYAFHYHGFDISDRMIDKAEELHQELSGCQFTTDGSTLRVADYTVASGIFNVKLRNRDDEWREYVLSTLHTIAELSELGFAFNALTIYSDPEFMRPDLFYADPLHLFDYCKRNFSRFVTVLHDYPLYEFTILVRM
jgi:SAM-dependent methyltransferase